MKPSGRFKKRYVSFSLSLDGRPPTFEETRKLVHEHFISMFGELGIALLAFKLVEYDGKRGRGIVRCARERVDEAIFCMACLSELAGAPCRMEPLSTSGSIRRV